MWITHLEAMTAATLLAFGSTNIQEECGFRPTPSYYQVVQRLERLPAGRRWSYVVKGSMKLNEITIRAGQHPCLYILFRLSDYNTNGRYFTLKGK